VHVEGLSAVTLFTRDMARAVGFYRELGFELLHGGEDATLSSFRAGSGFLNVMRAPQGASWSGWGRVILHVDDVDAFHARALALGLSPEDQPRDAAWGERYFHLRDPDGHELSFAKLLP
jgi:catechol 2,3-dioxygenase-like lactoylglutathione lyase family enzyme